MRAAPLLPLFALTSLSLAASPVGKWNGRIQTTLPKLPADATAQQKQQYAQITQMLQKMVMKLDMKANKTFTVQVPAAMGRPAQRENGTWSQTGNKVTLKDKKGSAQTFTLSGDGKTMMLNLPKSSGANGRVIFKKA